MRVYFIHNILVLCRNNGGGHYNHSFFWKIMTNPSNSNGPSSDLKSAIDSSFGSLDELKTKFNAAAAGRFGKHNLLPKHILLGHRLSRRPLFQEVLNDNEKGSVTSMYIVTVQTLFFLYVFGFSTVVNSIPKSFELRQITFSFEGKHDVLQSLHLPMLDMQAQCLLLLSPFRLIFKDTYKVSSCRKWLGMGECQGWQASNFLYTQSGKINFCRQEKVGQFICLMFAVHESKQSHLPLFTSPLLLMQRSRCIHVLGLLLFSLPQIQSRAIIWG